LPSKNSIRRVGVTWKLVIVPISFCQAKLTAIKIAGNKSSIVVGMVGPMA